MAIVGNTANNLGEYKIKRAGTSYNLIIDAPEDFEAAATIRNSGVSLQFDHRPGDAQAFDDPFVSAETEPAEFQSQSDKTSFRFQSRKLPSQQSLKSNSKTNETPTKSSEGSDPTKLRVGTIRP